MKEIRRPSLGDIYIHDTYGTEGEIVRSQGDLVALMFRGNSFVELDTTRLAHSYTFTGRNSNDGTGRPPP